MDRELKIIRAFTLLMMFICLNAYGQIYKIVDKDGNVIYTDQAPADGTVPMELPELSVISTDVEDVPAVAQPAVPDPEDGVTPRDLRKLYHDFRISRPAPEETFWGTENSVVIAWEATEPLREDLTVRFTVDGSAQTASDENMKAVTLERGSHTVSAAIVDAKGRPLVTTDTVTFYVHQQTVRGNRP